MNKFISISFSLVIFLLPDIGFINAQEVKVNESASKIDTIKYQTDEVVVIGTRTTKKIIDIPYPVVRISNKQYKYDRKTSINDVLNVAPGIFMQNRYGNHDVRISIRGFGSRSNSGIRGVRILLDGIPESEPDGQTRIEAIDFNSVGSIEIVKGNSSSLYTNAPGGVVNFVNDINFPNNFVTIFNDFGSYNLRRNGFKLGYRTPEYSFLATYTYHNYKGYRKHSEDYWHIVNTVFETDPTRNSTLKVLGYFVNGLIRLPGSLTKTEYDADAFQAAKREVEFDFRRISKKGRVGFRFNTKFGKDLNNELEITPYISLKYFHRTDRRYRIINRFVLGSTARFTNKSVLFGNLTNEFTIGSDYQYQSGPVEEYNNLSGKKGDILNKVTDEVIGNTGFFIQDNLELIKNKLFVLVTGRYDNVYFDWTDQMASIRSTIRRFEAFTPKMAFNYKLTPSISIYTSYGLSFDTPAGNELGNHPLSSDNGSKALNPDLKPQRSNNFELGIKGNIVDFDRKYFNNTYFEVTLFNYIIKDEIVPFEVYGDVFFRNSAKTNRTGIEIGGNTTILEGLKFAGAYAYSRFVYDDYKARTVVRQNEIIKDTTKDFSGNFVPTVPEHNLFSSLEYERNLSTNLLGFIKGTLQYISGLYVNDENEDITKSYTLLGFTTGFEYQLGRFSVLLSGGINNILNKKYVGFININSTAKRFYELGEPRTFFGSLRIGYTL